MPVAIDTETVPFTEAEPCPRLVSVAFADEGGASLFAAHQPELEGHIRLLFDQYGVVFANAPFDVFVLGRAFPSLWPCMIDAYQHGRVFDVLTREKLIAHATGRRPIYGLGGVAMEHAGIALDKSEDSYRLRYGELLGLEIVQWPAEAQRYAIMDAVATWAVFDAQERVGVPSDPDRQARSHIALYDQTLHGINTDPEAHARVDGVLAAKWLEHTVRLLGAGLARVEGKKNRKVVRNQKIAQAASEAYANERGITVKRSEKTQQPSLAEDAMRSYRLPLEHPLQSYRLFGSLQAQRKKNACFSQPIVRTRYDECIATGRTSSSDPGEPWHGTNLQNVTKPDKLARMLGYDSPRDMDTDLGEGFGFRECLVPPPGHSFVDSDWSMMELVCLAQVQYDWFGRSTLGDALRAGRDPHAELGATIAGLPTLDGHPDRKKWRTLAKAPNFGYPGGLGAKRFCDFALGTYGIELTESRAKQLKKLWLQQWPEMKLYHDRINGMPRDAAGRIRITLDRTGFTRGGCTFPEACNFPFQGLAAACAKDALWALWLACQPGGPLEGCWLALFVHDENILVAKDDRAEHARQVQEAIMIQAVARLCPDVPVGVESAVLKRYTK